MTTTNITPCCDMLIQDIAKTMNQYMEGAITSPEVCLHIVVTLSNHEKRICDENDALLKALIGE